MSVVTGMSYSTILMARMRHDEMMREAERNRLAAQARRLARRTTRIPARPVIRLVMARTRLTAAGR